MRPLWERDLLSKRLPSKMIVGSRLFPWKPLSAQMQRSFVWHLHVFSRESADVFVWELDALSASPGVGEKGVKGEYKLGYCP